jgi:hypothetical protein
VKNKEFHKENKGDNHQSNVDGARRQADEIKKNLSQNKNGYDLFQIYSKIIVTIF